MKAVLFKNPSDEKSSIFLQEDKMPHFYDRLHYHPEIQVTSILKGSGTLFIGDKMSRFREGDVFLIGSNVPHVFRNDEAYYEQDSSLYAHSISSYIAEESIQSVISLPEFDWMEKLLVDANRGIHISGTNAEEVLWNHCQLRSTPSNQRFLLFVESLLKISQVEYSILSTTSYSNPQSERQHERINNVFDYIVNNYDRKIGLEEVADLVHMTAPAFSRYFKQRTRNTFVGFLNEYRIGQACQQLQELDRSIGEISINCGFSNLSNFNRQFKKVTGLTPRDYQKTYWSNL